MPFYTLSVTCIILAASLIPQALASVAGPVINNVNFPDPSIIWDNYIWYAFGTGTTVNIPYASSSDYNTWSLQTDPSTGDEIDALPTLPTWAVNDPGEVWAPDVNQLADGTFIMYFAAQTAADTSQHCIGAATSSSISGPYTPTSNTPLICPSSQGGSIDPNGFEDSNGQRYIVYKVGGNSMGHGGDCGNDVPPYVPTPIMLQPVEADGVTFNGTATQLLDNDGASDQGIVEAPSLMQNSNGYILFFSSGCFSTPNYTISYATATDLTGPYTRQGVLLQTGDYSLSSPGSADINIDGVHILFHANEGANRVLYTGIVSIADLTVTI